MRLLSRCCGAALKVIQYLGLFPYHFFSTRSVQGCGCGGAIVVHKNNLLDHRTVTRGCLPKYSFSNTKLHVLVYIWTVRWLVLFRTFHLSLSLCLILPQPLLQTFPTKTNESLVCWVSINNRLVLSSSTMMSTDQIRQPCWAGSYQTITAKQTLNNSKLKNLDIFHYRANYFVIQALSSFFFLSSP